MHEYSGVKACFEHSNFFKVNLPASQDTRYNTPPHGRVVSEVRQPWRNKNHASQPGGRHTTKFTFVLLQADLGIKITLAAWSYWLQFSSATLRHGAILSQGGTDREIQTRQTGKQTDKDRVAVR